MPLVAAVSAAKELHNMPAQIRRTLTHVQKTFEEGGKPVEDPTLLDLSAAIRITELATVTSTSKKWAATSTIRLVSNQPA